MRSILPDVQESVEIVWLYTTSEAVRGREDGWVGLPAIGGANPVKDVFQTCMTLGGKHSKRIEEIVTRLLAAPCDAYWVVSHNEGLRVALELCERSERPVHLTIQDDWAGALCARSKRYKALAPLARRMSDRTIKAVSSIDVTSEGMREYYKQRTGIDSVVIHPVIPEPLPPAVDQFARDKVTVGHAGSLYATREFLIFAEALEAFARTAKRTAEIRMWGPALALGELPEQIRKMVTILPTCEEQKLVGELAHCHFLYAMYPFSRNLQIFAQTSLPTKLSTYVQSQRPILGHGPAGSTLAAFLRDTQTGVMWSTAAPQDGVQSIRCLMQMSVDRQKWEQAHNLYYGKANVSAIVEVFQKLAAPGC